MAQPVFLSYAWSDPEVDDLDDLLRWRGVPVWRDRRAMGFGDYQEDKVRSALREECSGFALYLTENALASQFICGIELPTMDDRRSRDPEFFAGAVFRDSGVSEGQRRVHERCGVTLSAELGHVIDSSSPLRPQLATAANGILAGYLRRERGDGPAEIMVDTRSDVSWRADGLLHIAWNPPLEHCLDAHDDACWGNDLLPALRDVRAALEGVGGERSLQVRGRAHLSAALALGYEFRLPTQWRLMVRDQEDRAWNAAAAQPDLDGWRAEVRPGPPGEGGNLVCVVHATHDISRWVREHVSSMPVARATLNVFPPEASNNRSVEPASANALAVGIADAMRAARRDHGTTETHLYFAGPWPLAALLGWHLASSGPIVSYEATEDRSGYVRACRLT